MAKATIRSNGFIYVPVHVKHRNLPNMLTRTYKVDTGANSTTISRTWLEALGYDAKWVLENGKPTFPTSASGAPIKDCYRITLPEISIGDWIGGNWEFTVTLNAEIDFRLLLGTDTMQFFNWHIDYGNMSCVYNFIQSKRKLLSDDGKRYMYSVE